MPASIKEERRHVNGGEILREVVQETETVLRQVMSTRLTLKLAEGVEHLLGRERYERRQRVACWAEQTGKCAKCGSQQSRRFSRNGSRRRCLSTLWGDLRVQLPRVVCECGGSVGLDFGGCLRPYQRLGDDVDAQIKRWGAMCLSLRQMQAELGHTAVGGLGLRTLLVRLHQCQDLLPTLDADDIPPIVQVDAIWVTQLRPNGHTRRDAKGRLRTVKGRFKRPILIAQGLWPDSGRRQILAFELAESEDKDAWLTFLTHLEQAGIRGQNGLELLIHDGGSGLCAALSLIHFGAAEQRCLFHKLRNIAKALKLPDDLSAQERKRQKKALLKDFQAIWQAKHYSTLLRRYLHVVRQYRHSQPDAVATLQRDFRTTVTYYQLELAHPAWPRSFLRTTSHLERFNRTLRRHARAAGAFHSDAGILAMLARSLPTPTL